VTSGRWADSTRSSRLPANWPRIVQQIKTRDRGRCRSCGITCAYLLRGKWRGGQVDHIQHGDDHHPANLQLLCNPCHTAKTQAEANDRPRRTRTPEPHPGTPQQAPRGGG
jgi:5-methylcytosine-specific restriction protein A